MHQHYLWDKTGEIDPFTARLELALVEQRRKVQAIGARCSGAAISSNEALPNEVLANEALQNEVLPNEVLPNKVLPNKVLANKVLASQTSSNLSQCVSRPDLLQQDVLLSKARATRLSTGRVLAAASMLVAAATLVLWLGHHATCAGVSETAPKPLASGVDMDASGGASALRGAADPLVAGGLGSDCDPAEHGPVPDGSGGVAGDSVAGDPVAKDPVEGLGVDAQPAVVAPATAR